MQNFFKRIMGEKKKPFLFTTKNLAVQTGNGDRIRTQNDSHALSGFVQVSDWASEVVSNSYYGSSTGGMSLPVEGKKTPTDERKAVEPKEVFEEVKRENIEMDFSNLDEKIKVVSERIEILKEHLPEEHLGDEHKALFFLKNRRKYLDIMKKTPLDWAMTNREALDDLCKRYKLQVVPLKQYYTLVPKEGVSEMSRYTKVYQAITGDKPIFELVIKHNEVKKEEEHERKKKDRDPILVANSPLGDFMFVLGAWDDEVEYVDEIIYNGK